MNYTTYVINKVIYRYIPHSDERGNIVMMTDANRLYVDWYYHCEDKPVFESPEGEEWRFNNKWHRYNGPAVIWTDTKNEPEWYIHGNRINPVQYKNWLIEMGMDINSLTPEDKILIDLKMEKQ